MTTESSNRTPFVENEGTHPWRRFVAIGDSFTEGVADREVRADLRATLLARVEVGGRFRGEDVLALKRKQGELLVIQVRHLSPPMSLSAASSCV